jgi:hypothetical protein
MLSEDKSVPGGHAHGFMNLALRPGSSSPPRCLRRAQRTITAIPTTTGTHRMCRPANLRRAGGGDGAGPG